MNLSKDDLLKIALNSKPKKEILEKKSKAELIEYLFGIQVNECGQKKLNACRTKLEKCDGNDSHVYNSLYNPPRYNTITGLPSIQQSPPMLPSQQSPRAIVRERINETNEFIPSGINVLAVEDRIKQLDSIVNSWNTVERPQILKLLEDSKVAIREWINQQKPFFENKISQLEETFNRWQSVEKPLIENQIRELGETRVIIQEFDQTLAREAIRKINEFQTTIPNNQQQIGDLEIKLDLIQPVLSQLRNEHLKLLQLTEPIANFESFISRLVNDQAFLNNFALFKNEVASDFNQRIGQLENSLQYRIENVLQNEPGKGQVGQIEMQIDQMKLQLSQFQNDNSLVLRQIDSMKESLRESLNESTLREYLLSNLRESLREFFEKYINDLLNKSFIKNDEKQSIFRESLLSNLGEQLRIQNDKNQSGFQSRFAIINGELSQIRSDSETVISRFNELQSTVSNKLSQLQLDYNSRLALEDGKLNGLEELRNDTLSLYNQFRGLKEDVTSNLAQLQLEFNSNNESFQRQLQIVVNESKTHLDYNSRLALEYVKKSDIEQLQAQLDYNSRLALEYVKKSDVEQLQAQLQVVANELKAPELQIIQLKKENALILQQVNELKTTQLTLAPPRERLAIEAPGKRSIETRINDLERLVVQNNDNLKQKIQNIRETQTLTNSRLEELDLEIKRIKNLINLYSRSRRIELDTETRAKRTRMPTIPSLPE